MQEAKTSNMVEAKRNKNDEFYTQLTDIEKELKHYKDHFRDKMVFCNCDDPFESNFFKYFVLNFNRLGLKSLMTISYIGSAILEKRFVLDGGEVLSGPYKAVVTKVYDINQDGQIDMSDIEDLFRLQENELIPLHGDGDFRSEESIEMLKEADIVVTNPPFSLFREYVAQLVEYGKKFVIIGNKNAITHKEIFPMIKDEKLWLGYNSPKRFVVPRGTSGKKTEVIDGVTYQTFGNIGWFTNMDIAKRHEELILVRKYDPEVYPKYDNYDAINVDKVKDIPEDYNGVMGVPITFLDKYNPEQFEILGIGSGRDEFEIRPIKRYVGAKQINKNGTIINGSKANTRTMIKVSHIPQGAYYTADNADGILESTYARIFIKKKKKIKNR